MPTQPAILAPCFHVFLETRLKLESLEPLICFQQCSRQNVTCNLTAVSPMLMCARLNAHECTLECSVSARLNAHECTLECSWVHAWMLSECTLECSVSARLNAQWVHAWMLSECTLECSWVHAWMLMSARLKRNKMFHYIATKRKYITWSPAHFNLTLHKTVANATMTRHRGTRHRGTRHHGTRHHGTRHYCTSPWHTSLWHVAMTYAILTMDRFGSGTAVT